MHAKLTSTFLAALLFLPGMASATEAEASRERSMAERKEILANLEVALPGAATLLRQSGGYATFKALGAGGGVRSKGVAKIQQTRQDVFMRADPVKAAPNTKPYDVVFVFATREDLSRFGVSRQPYGGQRAAGEGGKLGGGEHPGAVPVAKGVWAYVLDGKRLQKDPIIPVAVYQIDGEAN